MLSIGGVFVSGSAFPTIYGEPGFDPQDLSGRCLGVRDQVRLRRKWHDPAHRPRRIRLRSCDPRHRCQRSRARGLMQKISAGKFHGVPFRNAVGTGDGARSSFRLIGDELRVDARIKVIAAQYSIFVEHWNAGSNAGGALKPLHVQVLCL